MAWVGAVIGAAQLGIGLANSAKAKREAEENERNRPKYQISPEVGNTLSLTESELANGLSARTKQAYETANDKALSSSLAAILKRGGNLNNVGDLYAGSEEGRLKLAMLQDDLRLKQIQNVVAARQNKQQEQQTKWMIDEFGPSQDRMQATGQARIAAQGQIWNGVNTLGSSAMQYGQQKHEEKLFEKYFNGGDKMMNVGNGFDANADYSTWKENQRLDSLPISTVNGQPSTGKFGDPNNNAPQTNYLGTALANDPSLYLNRDNPVFNLYNRPI